MLTKKNIEDNFQHLLRNARELKFDNGWNILVADMLKKIEKIDKDFNIYQIKQKFGQLRVYGMPSKEKLYEKVFEVITYYERQSIKICEQCGAQAKILDTRYAWRQYLCLNCFEKRGKK